MKHTTKTLCLLIVISGASLDAMAGFKNAATRAGGYFRKPQTPINTFAFGNKMPYNPTGAQQQTWWQRTKDTLQGRDYPYAYPQYVRDVTATKNAFRTNLAALLTTLGLTGMATYIATQEDVSEKYKHYRQIEDFYKQQEEKTKHENAIQKALMQRRNLSQE